MIIAKEQRLKPMISRPSQSTDILHTWPTDKPGCAAAQTHSTRSDYT
ncbi:hypothetical protein [uncultured Thiodictyon sp.]|nr:hypothetical protein [uncultured Thiodictyon sp.]